MLMILKHYDYINNTETDRVLDINTQFTDFICFNEKDSRSGKTYCEIKYVLGDSNRLINILGTIEQAVDKINDAITEVKRRYPEHIISH